MKGLLRIPFFLLVLLFLCMEKGYAAASDPLLLGDSAYRRQAYDSAVSYYERAAKSGDAESLFKYGNALYQRNRKGEAVLAWCNALQSRPGFAAALHNIEATQQGLKYGNTSRDDAAIVRWWRSAIGPAASNAWAILALVLFGGLTLHLATRRLRRKPGPGLRPPVLTGIAACALFCAILAVYAAYGSVPRSKGVVMHADAPCMLGGKGSSIISLPEGLLVTILSMQKDSTHIVLPDGQEGFVQGIDIALVK